MTHILYSFRRCPYAMRARLAITTAAITVELREVVLRNKPQQLLDISPKATVPVLLLLDGTVIEESLEIMTWALSKNDPENWLNTDYAEDIQQLIQWNDNEFKYYLDRYKYADRYPEHDQQYYREKAETFLTDLEKRLDKQAYLCNQKCSLADMAIFPFIRQFANVNLDWFQTANYPKLNRWLKKHLKSCLFISIMDKYPAWQAGDKKLIFNEQ
ncbi:MAG: glutathione S-transferase [Methylococcaceae bacterium]